MSDIRIRAGDTLSWAMRLSPGEGPAEIAGLTPRCVLRGPSGTVMLTAIVYSAADRMVLVSAPATRTATLQPGVYTVDLQLASPGGIVRSSVSRQVQVEEGLDG